MDTYGRQLLVTLIDQKGNEQEVGEAYETEVRMLGNQDVLYLPFDFHEECKNNNYARLQVLVDRAESVIKRNGYFLQDEKGNILLEQQGNVRTNCIDCLDRTNVVQSQFGRLMLKEQLANLGIVGKDESFDPNLVALLNHVWTNNADTLSKRYTGVGALKTDFTRTGKRSAKGAVADGVKSVSRLYHSTFNDDTKQDATEFFLGKFSFERARDFLSEPLGVTRYKALKKGSWDSKGEPVIVELDGVTNSLGIYSAESAIFKKHPLSEICQVSRYLRHFCGLSLLLSSSSVSKRLVFASVLEREKFIIRLARIQSGMAPVNLAPAPLIDVNPPLIDLSGSGGLAPEQKLPGLPVLPPRTHNQSSSAHRPIKFFVGSINHNLSSFHDPPALDGSIPRDRDVYVLGAQNCNYQVPREFFLSSAAHWSYSVQSFLGDEFKVVKISSVGSRLITIVLVRTDLIFAVGNIEVSYTVLAPVRAAPAPSKPSGGFGGFFNKITSEVKKGFTSPEMTAPSEAEYMGIALAFTIHETAVCFINTNRCDLPFRVLGFDLANDFHHCFLFGDVPAGSVREDQWVTLHQDSQFGSILWRTLLDSNLEGIVTSRPGSAASPLPVSACFTLRALYYEASEAQLKAKIVLHDLTAFDLESGDRVPRLFDPYLIIHGPVASRHARTASKPRVSSIHSVQTSTHSLWQTFSPIWDEVLTLPTVPTSLPFLAEQYLVARVYDQEEGYVIGRGIIRIKPGALSLGTTYDFAARLSVFDETRGLVCCLLLGEAFPD